MTVLLQPLVSFALMRAAQKERRSFSQWDRMGWTSVSMVSERKIDTGGAKVGCVGRSNSCMQQTQFPSLGEVYVMLPTSTRSKTR